MLHVVEGDASFAKQLLFRLPFGVLWVYNENILPARPENALGGIVMEKESPFRRLLRRASTSRTGSSTALRGRSMPII